jgi:diadenosine tetraphosphatase ApaH/serine/threonine PP2A family protein phosphatase
VPVAAIYDVHGNLPALEAVIADARRAGVDSVLVGGDVVPGPMPRESLEALLDLDLPVRFIRGNGDRVVVAQRAGEEPHEVPERFRDMIRWCAEQMDAECMRTMASWPATLRARIDGVGTVLFCHATPRSDTDLVTRLTPDDRILPALEGLGADVVVCGHTHMQFDRTVAGRVRLVNAGSVGMPYGDPLACWLLLGPSVELRRTPYDLEAAAARIRATAYPGADDFAERGVLRPPAEREMLELFTRT